MHNPKLLPRSQLLVWKRAILAPCEFIRVVHHLSGPVCLFRYGRPAAPSVKASGAPVGDGSD